MATGKEDDGWTQAEHEAVRESLMTALQQSADGDVESLGSFAQYADDK